MTATVRHRLTERQREVLLLLAARLTNAQIARRLFVSGNTVKTHLKLTFEALGARNAAQAVATALRLGEIT